MNNIEQIWRVDPNGDAPQKWLPVIGRVVPAGLPSDGDSWIDDFMNVHEYLVRNEEESYIVRVWGESMVGAGILSKDYVVVDRSREARDQDIVLASVGEEQTLKRLRIWPRGISLVAENPEEPQVITGEISIWGVVVASFRRY